MCFTYSIRSLTWPLLAKWGLWTHYVSHRRPGRPALAYLTRHLPRTHTGQWARTGYFLAAATRTGSGRPRQQKGSSQAVAVETTKETLSARCAVSRSLSLSLGVRFLAFFRFHIIIAFPMRVVHACHTVDCELVVGLIVWCQVLVQFSVHWRQLCVLWLLAGERA